MICSSDSSSSFSSSTSVITSAGCSEHSEKISSTDNGQDWLVATSASKSMSPCTSMSSGAKSGLTLRSWLRMATSLLSVFLSSSSRASYYHFVMLSFCDYSEHNTQVTFFHAFFGFFIFIFIIHVSNYLCRLFRTFRKNLFNRQWSRLVGRHFCFKIIESIYINFFRC